MFYNSYGYPTKTVDVFSQETNMSYDRFNRITAVEKPNGSKNVYLYDERGKRINSKTLFNNELLNSVDIAYDKIGMPNSYAFADGTKKTFERDVFGRVEKEIFQDDTQVGYEYDKLGRLAKVLDQNNNEINFAWNQYGLDSRTTAVGQMNKNSYDKFGKLTSIESKFDGSNADRKIDYTYDNLDRVVKVSYGKNEVETREYNTWGQLIGQAKNNVKTYFKYDTFGRLTEKREGESITTYTYDNYGKRLSRISKTGSKILDEFNTYDKFGRLVKTQSNGKVVEYVYNDKNQLAEQVIDGKKVVFEYTKLGQLERKAMLETDGSALAELKYFYSKDGKIMSRLANGKLQAYQYDRKNQLLAVIDLESNQPAEEYVYDPAGNILKKTVAGKITTYTYDATNQLVSSVCDGVETHYKYDAAGRMIQEGDKTYTYAWLDKVVNVAENGKTLASFEYQNNGQISKAIRDSGVETFAWDGLALIERNGVAYINEPHAGGGNPILATSAGVLNENDGNESQAISYTTQNANLIFTDILGTSLGEVNVNDSGAYAYSAIEKTSFGSDSNNVNSFFTGKPHVAELGYAFLFRNYRADTGKWLSQDPISLAINESNLSPIDTCYSTLSIGFPDGWNNMAYCSNMAISTVDVLGLLGINLVSPSDSKAYSDGNAAINSSSDTFYVVAHGSPGIGITGPDATPITAQELANIITSNSGYVDCIGDIVLLGCNSADGNLAQELANILNRFIKAFEGVVTIYSNGTYTGVGTTSIQPE